LNQTRNVLIITHGFYPEQSPRAFRATELAKELASNGHKVTVIAPYRVGVLEFAKEIGIEFRSIGELTWKIFNFKSFGLLGKIYNKVVNRLLPLLFEYPSMEIYFKIRKAIKEDTSKYDLLISIAVPHPVHWAVASLWENHILGKAKIWVADCGDPYMYAMHDTVRKPFYFHFFENLFLRRANYVSVPFEEMKGQFNPSYIGKFVVIPQGFKFVNHKLADYTNNSKITFAYAGTVMPGKRDPFGLIEYLEQKNYDYNFIVYTHQQHLFSKFQHLINKEIFLRDYIPREELIFELSKMDFLVNVNTASTDGVINAIPSKLIDYYFINRPVLSYEFGALPQNSVDDFMVRNFQDSFNFLNIDRYRIENVVNQFLNLK
jgi:hypothetical protein